MNEDLADISQDEIYLKKKRSSVRRKENDESTEKSFENYTEPKKSIQKRHNRNSASVTTREDDISAKMARFNAV